MWLIALAPLAVAGPDLAFDPDHTVALGARGSVWVSDYRSPGLGGHVDLRPWRNLGLQAFADHYALLGTEHTRHDYVLGFTLYRPLVGGDTMFLAPTLGSCVDLSFQRDPTRQTPSSSDVQWGVHAGVMAQWAVEPWLLVQLTGSATAYIGNQTARDGWSTVASTGLHPSVAARFGGAAAWRF
ncbi:MAG: hypothetical protein ACI8PZ_002963 [Myxococcota bacterium]|jgi:hypothetical protein